MSLAIDPTELDADDIGEQRATLDMDHDDAVEHVRHVFSDAGFGVPVEFSPSALLNEKVDADREPYYVLGACNPKMADRALDESSKIGGIFPCNVVIYEEERGVQTVYHVSIMKVARLVGIAPESEAWADIVSETGAMVEDAFANLDSR